MAATTSVSWLSHQDDADVDPDCELEKVKKRVVKIDATFGFKVDGNRLCTSLIRDVLHLHLQEMLDDGFVEKAWLNEDKKKNAGFCSVYAANSEMARKSDSEGGKPEQLKVIDMLGIYIFYFGWLVLAIFSAVVTFMYEKHRQKTHDTHTVDCHSDNGDKASDGKHGNMQRNMIGVDTFHKESFRGEDNNGDELTVDTGKPVADARKSRHRGTLGSRPGSARGGGNFAFRPTVMESFRDEDDTGDELIADDNVDIGEPQHRGTVSFEGELADGSRFSFHPGTLHPV